MELFQRAANKERVTANLVKGVAGFLNFVASLIRQGKPFIRSLFQCLAKAEVYSAWATDKRRLDPQVFLTPHALQDITWWTLASLAPLYRQFPTIGAGFSSGTNVTVISKH